VRLTGKDRAIRLSFPAGTAARAWRARWCCNPTAACSTNRCRARSQAAQADAPGAERDAARVGITFLLVTHDQEEALSMSDQLAVMNAGAIEQVGTPQDVYLRPRTRFVAGFLGAVKLDRRRRPAPGGDPHRAHAAVESGASVPHGHRLVFLGNCVHVLTRLESGEDVVAEIRAITARTRRANHPRLLESVRRDDLSMQGGLRWDACAGFLLPPGSGWRAVRRALAIVIVYSC